MMLISISHLIELVSPIYAPKTCVPMNSNIYQSSPLYLTWVSEMI